MPASNMLLIFSGEQLNDDTRGIMDDYGLYDGANLTMQAKDLRTKKKKQAYEQTLLNPILERPETTDGQKAREAGEI